MLWADVHAGRFEADVHPVGAVIALGSGAGIWVNVERIVGAGLHAGLAADAAVFVKINDAIGPEIKGLHWADFNAGCIRAVVAAHHGEHPAGMREHSFFHLLNPSPEHANGHIVLRFTGGGAGVATNALSVVNDKAVFHANDWLNRVVIKWP